VQKLRNVQLFSVIPAKAGIRRARYEIADSCFRRNDRGLEKVAHGVKITFLRSESLYFSAYKKAENRVPAKSQ
jgi:hypothetical protein